MYTSEDFVLDYPTLTQREASRLCAEHGAQLSDFLDDCERECVTYLATGAINTDALVAWLGY